MQTPRTLCPHATGHDSHGSAASSSVEQSLDNLKLMYVDLLLVHMPFGLNFRGEGNYMPTLPDGTLDYALYVLNQTWSAMEGLVKEGIVRCIGLSNFTQKQMEKIIATANIKPHNVQFECHSYYKQNVLRKFLNEKGIPSVIIIIIIIITLFNEGNI